MLSPKSQKKLYLIPLMLIMALLTVLGMLRLGIWQLDRAAEKQQLLDQVHDRAESAPQTAQRLVERISNGEALSDLRFQPVSMVGHFLPEHSILIENQVLNKRGGYIVITPFKVSGLEQLLMVSRGWIAVGATRQDLPSFSTPSQTLTIIGRLNMPPAKPPFWKDGYPVNESKVWQYLPIAEYAHQIGEEVLPLMVELTPENEGTDGLIVQWQSINDKWVAKHKGYAFQWFAMAAAFFIACLVLLITRASARNKSLS